MKIPVWADFKFPPINLWSMPPIWQLPAFKVYWYAKYRNIK